MSAGTAVADAPSLTLPDWRTALKRRIKRKPPQNKVAYLFKWLTMFNSVNDIIYYLGDPRPSYIVAAIGNLLQWAFWRKAAYGEMANPIYLLTGAVAVISSLVMP